MSSHLITELKRSKYRLLGLVGQGQFGRVFCAIHRKTGRLVALKELDQQRFPTHKFLRELRFLLSLQQANIVTCHALEHTSTGRRYLIMDYCEGGTLRSLMEEDVRLNKAQTLKLVAEILAGLEHAHSRGIVHCDIKPENILLSLQPTGWTARISDFGIARLSQELADTSDSMGSPAYMAPERFYGQYSHSSDLYAVGILLFELLVGYRPFSGPPGELMSAHLNQPVKVPETVPAALRLIILTALQKLPGRRFHSATEMLQAVRVAAADLDSIALNLPLSPLFQFQRALPICPFKSVRQERLKALISCLAVASELPGVGEQALSSAISSIPSGQETTTSSAATSTPSQGERIYRAIDNQLGCEAYATGILNEAEGLKWGIRLPEPIRGLTVRPQGCFAITDRSIYLLTNKLPAPAMLLAGDVAKGQKQSSERLIEPPAPRLLTQFSRDFVAAIDAQGRWLATVIVDPACTTSALTIWQLPSLRHVKKSVVCKSAYISQLLALDSHHIATISGLPRKSIPTTAFGNTLKDPFEDQDQDNNKGFCNTSTVLEVLTRRGDWIGSLNLSVSIEQVITTTTPYRLLATEQDNPTSVLLIDLKPFRILRIGIEIAPTLLAAAAWGYIVADAHGQIVLLDHDGQGIDRIDGPAAPTAIAPFNNYGLLVSTWNGNQGSLYTIDLRQLDIGLMF